MKRLLLIIVSIISLFCLSHNARGQGTQTVSNGGTTTAINFPGTGCVYNWVNNTPGIGLAATGTGNIPSFTAVNNGSSPVTATITATAAPTRFAYITSDVTGGTVSVIDTRTNTVAATIPVGAKPIGVAISPDGSRVYVTNSGSNTISVINTVSNTVEAVIPTGPGPYGISVSPDGSLVYVTNALDYTVSVINTVTYAIIAEIKVGSQPVGISISADGSRIYVANAASNNVSIINTATDTVISTIPVGASPYGVFVTPDGSGLYVANEGSDNVTVINTTTYNIIATIPVGNAPFGVCVSPDGSSVFVSNSGSHNNGPLQIPPGTVSVINTAASQVVNTITVGLGPTGISFSPDGSRVYVANNFDNSTSVISTASNTVIATVAVGTSPSSLGNFVAGGAGCSGAPITYTITVTPKLLPPSITTDTATGIISACEGTASPSPNVQQFSVSGSSLTGNITVTAPTGFQVSLASGSGYSSSVELTESGGITDTSVVYVCAASTAAKGSISGDVTLTSPGAVSRNVAVAATVNPAPIVNPIKNQTVNNGGATAAVNFTGTGSEYTWTNDTPGIGLATSGKGNIAPFTPVNNGNSPLTATITVTPLPKPKAFAYVANASSNSVSVINTTTNEVTDIIPVGSEPYGVAVSPDGSRVYVTNVQSITTSVINTATNSVTAIIPVAGGGVAVSPDGLKLYVCGDDNVTVVNTATNAVISTIVFDEYEDPIELALSPDGSRLYVTNNNIQGNYNNFYVINTATNAVVSVIKVGMASNGVAASPDGSRVYVANAFSNDISVINTATNAVIATISAGSGAYCVCLSPDGSRLYVSNSGDKQVGVLGQGTVSVISTTTNKVIATMDVGIYPIGISITPDGSEVYVVNDFGTGANGSTGTVSVINTETNQVKATVYVGYNPISVGNFVANETGCSGVPVTFTITVNPTGPTITGGAIVIPNTFTPNGDGINDTWDIKNLDGYANCTVQIFNRWGQNVYSSVGYGTPWDGTFKGAALPTGTYYYIINLKNNSKLLSGYVAIIR